MPDRPRTPWQLAALAAVCLLLAHPALTGRAAPAGMAISSAPALIVAAQAGPSAQPTPLGYPTRAPAPRVPLAQRTPPGFPISVPAGVPAETFHTFLPFIQRGCASSAQEQSLLALIANHPGQQRLTLACDPILEAAARAHAMDMAANGYVSHVDQANHGPNYRVQQAGYLLPADYDQTPTGNNIQLLAVGSASHQAVFDAWYASPGHRAHLLGEAPAFAQQTDIGVGYAYLPASPHVHYWVIITARRG